MFRNALQLGLALGIFAFPVAQAAPMVWVGTANYAAGPNGDATDGETVGDFDAYDAGPGVALIQGAMNAMENDVLNGYYQSYITAHTRNSATVNAPNLNTQGAGGGGSGYELTMAAVFEETVTSVSGTTANFDMTGGTVNIYLDATPDYSFSGDSGFTDTGAILTGSIVGGGGTFTTGSSFSFGGALVEIMVTGFDSAVFEPDTIIAGTSVFTLQITPNNAEFLSGVSSVLTHNYNSSDDLLVVADGNLDLSAVPEPVSLLLVGSAIAGLVVVRRQRG